MRHGRDVYFHIRHGLMVVALMFVPLASAVVERGARMSDIDTAGLCCKTCRKGKACGDSCIARNETCRKPPGCACNAR